MRHSRTRRDWSSSQFSASRRNAAPDRRGDPVVRAAADRRHRCSRAVADHGGAPSRGQTTRCRAHRPADRRGLRAARDGRPSRGRRGSPRDVLTPGVDGRDLGLVRLADDRGTHPTGPRYRRFHSGRDAGGRSRGPCAKRVGGNEVADPDVDIRIARRRRQDTALAGSDASPRGHPRGRPKDAARSPACAGDLVRGVRASEHRGG
jgi:hypothetical protein